MKVMILAAGRGKRLSPLTDRTPKPLVEVGGKALIDYHVEGLVEAGFSQIVINLGYLGDQIREHCEQRYAHQVEFIFSVEHPEPLETGGGIFQALPLLGDGPFIVINADIWTDFPFKRLVEHQFATDLIGHLVLVRNPEHNQGGDFSLHDHTVGTGVSPRYTFSGISILAPRLFANQVQRRFPLAPLLINAAENQQISGELFDGVWSDVGTQERLTEINKNFAAQQRQTRL